jgi:hypothetical protein
MQVFPKMIVAALLQCCTLQQIGVVYENQAWLRFKIPKFHTQEQMM